MLRLIVAILCHSSHICHGLVVVVPRYCRQHHHRPDFLTTARLGVSGRPNDDRDDDSPDWDGIGASQFDNDMISASNINDNNNNNQNDNNDNNDLDMERVNPQKFGGRSSSSLFAQPPSNAPPSSIKNNNNNNFIVDERDYQLVSVFERTLPIQVALVVAIFGLVGFIGLSGGITDGSDRFSYDDNDVDTTTPSMLLLEPNIISNDPTPPIIVGPSVFL